MSLAARCLLVLSIVVLKAFVGIPGYSWVAEATRVTCEAEVVELLSGQTTLRYERRPLLQMDSFAQGSPGKAVAIVQVWIVVIPPVKCYYAVL